MNQDAAARDRILAAAVELMGEQGDARRVTVRAVAQKAAVGVGLINYHFRTKEALVDEAVQLHIRQVVGRWDEHVPRSADPVRRVRAMLKATARFLATHPQVSRTSILLDLEKPRFDDNTDQTFCALLAALRDAMPRQPDREVRLAAAHIISALQGAFLRKEVLARRAGLDFDVEADRDALVDAILAPLLPRPRRGAR